MISKIDSWLIDNVYQPIVDTSQLKPMWLARQCAAVAAIAGLARWGFKAEIIYWQVALITICYCGIYVLTFSEVHAKACFNSFWRKLGALSTSIGLTYDYFVPKEVPYILTAAGGLSYICYLYFIACRPPAPPKRKTQLQKGFA